MVRRKKSRGPKTAKVLEHHTYIRAAQRYGICLDAQDQQNIVKGIIDRKYELIDRQSNNRTVWRVEHNGIVMGVVYDKRLKAIATLIPPDDPSLRPQDEKNGD